MSIFIGNNDISEIYIGDKPVTEIYNGKNFIWQRSIRLYAWEMVGAYIGSEVPNQYIYTRDKEINNSTIFYDNRGIPFSRLKTAGGCAIWENNSLTITVFGEENVYNKVKSGIALEKVDGNEIYITNKTLKLYKWIDVKGYFGTNGCLLPISSYTDNFSNCCYIKQGDFGDNIIRPSFTETQDVWGLSWAISSDNDIVDAYRGIIFSRDTASDEFIYTYKWS